jgi:hypothetical protein
MKARVFFILSFSIWMAACLANVQPDAPTSDVRPTISVLVSTLDAASALAPSLTPGEPAPTVTVESSASFELIGHSPLLSRGMNAAPAVYGNYAYVGSRTDGSHPDAGVLVVDISDPTSPQVVHQIGPPEEGLVGQTSRELRVWPDQELLLVLNFSCEPGLHDCAPDGAAPPIISIYDISGANAAAPRLITIHVLQRMPHEMFLWDDPGVDGRALLYLSTPGRYLYSLLVIDISQARVGTLQEVANWGAPVELVRAGLHSLSLSVDGKRAYLAHLADGFMILDTSDLADGIPEPQMELLTPAQNWARFPVGPHSVVKLFGKPYVLITEEVYGRCPWGWTYIIDITDETRPQVVAEYKLDPYNTADHCEEVIPERYTFTSFSSHNPTLTKNLAFVTWHSGGLQAVSIENQLQPMQVTEFIPQPLPSVGTEDPALSSGPDKVVMWSYPIIKDGLIYVVDIRNGLYILQYHGPFEEEVAAIRFLEGNSNLGEAQQWEGP